MLATHPSQLALFANTAASVAYFGLMLLFIFAWATHLRPWFTLLGAAWLGLLCSYFAMLAISSGPDPIIDRGAFATPIRYTNLAATVLATCWALAWGAQIAGILFPRFRVRLFII